MISLKTNKFENRTSIGTRKLKFKISENGKV